MTTENVAQIDEKQKQKKAKEEGEGKKRNPSLEALFWDVARMLDGDRGYYPPQIDGWRPRHAVYQATGTSDLTILEIDERRVCREISRATLTAQLVSHLSECWCKFRDIVHYHYHWTPRRALEAVDYWMATTTKRLDRRPKPVAFLSDPDVTFYRHPYDPAPDEIFAEYPWDDEDLLREKCPHWHELKSRWLSNWQPFCAKLWATFEPTADRKQAVYISGPKDCGKSQIIAILRHLAGATEESSGCFKTLGNETLKNDFLTGMLHGKRLAVILEAGPSFFSTERFKSITGDSYHDINKKGLQQYEGRIDVLLWAVSNEPPAVRGERALMERIIDCRMASYEGPQIPDHEYQAALIGELPAFLAYCRRQYAPGRIKAVEMEHLEESSQELEQDAISTFEHCFVQDAESWMETTEIKDVVCGFLQTGSFRDWETWRKVWKHRYGLTYKRRRCAEREGKPVWGYLGLRRRQSDEKPYVAFDED